MKNILIVTRHFPPILNGPSIILSRLVKHWPENSVSIFTRDFYASSETTDLNFTTDNSIRRFSWGSNRTRIDRIKEFVNIRRLVKAICSEALEKETQAILGVTDDGPFFISSYLAAKRLGIPLVVYMLDLFEEGRRGRIQQFFARHYDRKVLSYAFKVLVMSEGMQDYYKNKYSIDCVVVHHPIEDDRIVDKVNENSQVDFKSQPLKIVFTGHITAAQASSIRDLIKIVGENPKEFNLSLCVPALNTGFKNLPSNVAIKSLNHQEVLAAQRNADVLFLPYSFNNPYPDVISTASPGKLPEYLAAGRPILFYGPDYSYVKWYFDKNKAALCVTVRDKTKLLQSLRNLRDDQVLRNNFKKNAIKTAHLHRASIVSKIALQAIFKNDI